MHQRRFTFDTLDHAPEANELLRNLSGSKNVPHLLFHGPRGSGKYTRMIVFLRAVFGDGVAKMESGTQTIDTASKAVDVEVRSSPFHIELIPSDYGTADRLIIQEYVSSLSKYRTLKSTPGEQNFRVIVLHEAEHLTMEAQQALRRTMETDSAVCRFVLLCHNASSLIAPIRSRCVMVRVPAPTKCEMTTIVRKLGGDELVLSISEGNIRVAEWCCWAKQQTGEVFPVEWKRSVFDFTQALLKCKNAREFDKSLRMQLFEILALVSPDDVMTEIFKIVLRSKLTDDQKLRIPEIAARHNCQMMLGREPMLHVEAFCIELMGLWIRN